jgi:hypothetical protein
VFTARYALSPYIKQTRFVFKGLKGQEILGVTGVLSSTAICVGRFWKSRVNTGVLLGAMFHRISNTKTLER